MQSSDVNKSQGSYDKILEDKITNKEVNYRLWPNIHINNLSKDTLIDNEKNSSNTKDTFNFFPTDSFKPSMSFTEQFFGLNQQRLPYKYL